MAFGKEVKLFTGNSNARLCTEICEHLGIQPGKAEVKRFSDGEVWVEIKENVRGSDVFVIQSTSAPANENLMELLIMIDALKRASVDRITAIVPYYGYGRQDRKVQPRTPITAKLVADLLTAVGTHRVVSMDLHAGQIQGFFNIPFDHLYATPIFLDYIKHHFRNDIVMVTPDAGGTERAFAFAKRLDCGLAVIDKRRPAPNQSKIMHIIGDVKDKTAIIVDDMVDTAGTLAQAADAIKENGAKKVFAMATHAVLSGPAIQRINECSLEKLIVTNTINIEDKMKESTKLESLSIAPLLGEAIKRITYKDSVSSLFV